MRGAWGGGARRFLSSAARPVPAPVPPYVPFDIRIPGLTLRGLSLGSTASKKKVLALHGWMDNSATVLGIAVPLLQAGYHLISLDLPGHGLSDHRKPADTYSVASHTTAVLDTLRAMHLLPSHGSTLALLGHSMGAGVAAMAAAALGPRCEYLIAIEGIGMNTKEEASSPRAMAAFDAARGPLITALHSPAGSEKPRRVYPSLRHAAAARVRTVANYPGNQSLSLAAAELLVERGTQPAPAAAVAVAGVGSSGSPHTDGIVFSHDLRLIEPSPLYMSEAQCVSVMEAIACPVLCITATHGWPWSDGQMIGRLSSVQSLEHHHIQGGHHVHMDPDTSPVVSQILSGFIDRVERVTTTGGDAARRRAHHRQQHGSDSSGLTSAAADITSLGGGEDGAASSSSTKSAEQRVVVVPTDDASALLGPSHVFIARTVPWTVSDGDSGSANAGERGNTELPSQQQSHSRFFNEAVAPPAAAAAHAPSGTAASDPVVAKVHLHTGRLSVLAAHPSTPREGWAPRWHPYRDSLVGRTARLLRQRGIVGKDEGIAAGGGAGAATTAQQPTMPRLEFGAWAPGIILDALPTLEKAMAAAAAASSAAPRKIPLRTE